MARPAGARDGTTAIAEGMDGYGKSGFGGGLIDRPIAAIAERLAGAREHQHLDEILVSGPFANFSCGNIRRFIGHDDRCLEAAILRRPLRDLPLVGRGAERGAELGIRHALPALQRIEDAEDDIVRIEMLGLHETETAAGPAAFRRQRIAPRRIRLPFRERGTRLHREPARAAERLEMVTPASRQPRTESVVAAR